MSGKQQCIVQVSPRFGGVRERQEITIKQIRMEKKNLKR